MTIEELIDSKGAQHIADALNRPVGSIYVWRHRGCIPRLAWPNVMLAFPEIGLRDLLEMEKARVND